jgi:hypothetical protein
MPAPIVEFDIKFQDGAGLAPNQGVWFRTRRTTWPPVARLELWATIGGETFFVNLGGRAAPQRSVWAILVVPMKQLLNIVAKRISP